MVVSPSGSVTVRRLSQYDTKSRGSVVIVLGITSEVSPQLEKTYSPAVSSEERLTVVNDLQ